MITIYISSIIRTEETSLVGSKMAWPSGHGRFITVHTSLLRALPLIHLDEIGRCSYSEFKLCNSILNNK